jgi:hypothetical protein
LEKAKPPVEEDAAEASQVEKEQKKGIGADKTNGFAGCLAK